MGISLSDLTNILFVMDHSFVIFLVMEWGIGIFLKKFEWSPGNEYPHSSVNCTLNLDACVLAMYLYVPRSMYIWYV